MNLAYQGFWVAPQQTSSIGPDSLRAVSKSKTGWSISKLTLPPIFSFQSDDAVNPDRMYDLVAVVIHCGSGPNRGHYISIVKSCGFWLIFDDDIVDVSMFLNNLYKVGWEKKPLIVVFIFQMVSIK